VFPTGRLKHALNTAKLNTQGTVRRQRVRSKLGIGQMLTQIRHHGLTDDVGSACGLAGFHLSTVGQSGDGFEHVRSKRDLDALVPGANTLARTSAPAWW